LGLEPRLGREQSGLFYQAVTRADRYLLLTRPYLADDGERWEASPYWHAVTSLLPDQRPECIQPEGLRALSEAASPEEILFWAAIHANLPESYRSSLGSQWEQLQRARRVLQDCQASTARGPYQGYTPSLTVELRQRYGANHTWSASRLEAYGGCPYRFFSEVSLELQAISPPELGFNAAQLGSLLHDILKEVYQRAQDPGDLESVLSILSGVALQLFKDAPDRFGFRPSLLWKVEQAQLITSLEKTIRGISELEGGWIPIAMERMFGIESTPALELEIIRQDATDEVIPDGRIRLRGIIDRVDKNATGQLRVIDYKAGSSHMTARDLIDGRRLQLPLYALAARDALGLGSPVEGLYWAILANKAGSLKLSTFRHNNYYGFTGSVDLVRQHIGISLAGIYQGVFPPQPPGSGCPAYCAEASWCWRYTPER
jgi:ATP-dependent helicase/DNAse subunit B